MSLDMLSQFFIRRTNHYLGWCGTTVCRIPNIAYPRCIQTYDEENDDGGDDGGHGGGHDVGDDGGDDGDNFDLLCLVPRVDSKVSHHTGDFWQSTGSH